MESITIKVKPVLRIYSVRILAAVICGIFLLKLLTMVPEKGYYISDFIVIKNQWIKSKLINILKYNISYFKIKQAVLISILMLLTYLAYLWLKVKTTTYCCTNKYLEVVHGILNQKNESLDVVDIRDQEMNRNIIHRLVGISQIIIISRDVTTPRLEILLDKKDANEIMDFLKVYSTKSIVDYQITRDLKKKSKSNRNLMPVEDGEDQ